MPVELQVIRASEFIRLDASEHFDLTASKEVLRTLAQACRRRGLECALLDLRTLPVLPRPQFTMTELAALVGTFREAGFTRQQRLAILYRHDVHGGIRNFAFFSRLRRMQVQAFSEFESAFLWLAEGTSQPGASPSQGVAISITTPASEAEKLPASKPAKITGRRPARPARRTPRR